MDLPIFAIMQIVPRVLITLPIGYFLLKQYQKNTTFKQSSILLLSQQVAAIVAGYAYVWLNPPDIYAPSNDFRFMMPMVIEVVAVLIVGFFIAQKLYKENEQRTTFIAVIATAISVISYIIYFFGFMWILGFLLSDDHDGGR